MSVVEKERVTQSIDNNIPPMRHLGWTYLGPNVTHALCGYEFPRTGFDPGPAEGAECVVCRELYFGG